MKQFVLAAAALAVVALPSLADDKKKSKTPTEIKCAVMTGNKVNIKDATEKKMYADYKGNRYFFCCGGCPAAFKKDPAKYAKADHIATPKEAPKKKG